MLLNNLLGSALAFAHERDEGNTFFYDPYRWNHLLFHALRKWTDSNIPFGLPPPSASLQHPPVSLVCSCGWKVAANGEEALQPSSLVQERKKMPWFLCCPRLRESRQIIVPQPACVPLGEPLHTGYSVEQRQKNFFFTLPECCEDEEIH